MNNPETIAAHQRNLQSLREGVEVLHSGHVIHGRAPVRGDRYPWKGQDYHEDLKLGDVVIFQYWITGDLYEEPPWFVAVSERNGLIFRTISNCLGEQITG